MSHFASNFASPHVHDYPSSPQHTGSPSTSSRRIANNDEHCYHVHNPPHRRHEYRPPTGYVDHGEQLQHNLAHWRIKDDYQKTNAIEVYSPENELYTNAPHTLPRVPSPNQAKSSYKPLQTQTKTTTTTTKSLSTPSKTRTIQKSSSTKQQQRQYATTRNHSPVSNTSYLTPSSSSSSTYTTRQESLPSSSSFIPTSEYEEEDRTQRRAYDDDNEYTQRTYEKKTYSPQQRSPVQKQEKITTTKTREIPVVEEEDEATRVWREYRPTQDEVRPYGVEFAKDVCTFLRHRHSIYVRVRNGWSMGLFYNRLYGFIYMCIFDGWINYKDRSSYVFQTYSENDFISWLSSQSDWSMSNHDSGPAYWNQGTLNKRVMEHAILSDDTELHWTDIRKLYTSTSTTPTWKSKADTYVQTA